VHRKALEELRGKYAEMLAMRVAHAAGDEEADEVRERMAALAARFPGALREIDDLELAEIRRKIAAIDAVLAGEQEVERWMEAVALFHALTRGALSAKRWLGGRKTVDLSVQGRFSEAAGALPHADDTRAWAADLALLASPPRGRLTDAVFARVARTLGIPEREARRLVFGVPRRERGKL